MPIGHRAKDQGKRDGHQNDPPTDKSHFDFARISIEPDLLDYLQTLRDGGIQNVVVMPIGFLSDHIEVMFDLDEQAAETANSLEMKMVRATTVGNHPRFIALLRKLIEERLSGREKEAIGAFGPNHDVCPLDCCPRPERPTGRPTRPAPS